MLQPPVTIPIAFVLGMLSGIRARPGEALVDVDKALEDAGIAPALLDEAAARITAEQYVALFALLMERMDDEALGFLTRRLRCGSFALMTRSTLGARTFEVALRRVARTFDLLQDDLSLVLLHDGPLAGFGLRLNIQPPMHQNFLHELMLRVYWRLFAWLHGGRLAARRFDFGFEPPPYADGYAKVFPGPLQFGQPLSAVWFDAAALDTPVHRDAKEIQAFLAASQPGASTLVVTGEELMHLAAAIDRLPGDERDANRARSRRPRDAVAALHIHAGRLRRRVGVVVGGAG